MSTGSTDGNDSTSQYGSSDAEELRTALDELAKELAGSDFRDSLKEDPEGAARGKDINVDVLPDGLLATLGTMSDEELQIVARVQLQLGTRLPSSSVAILF